MDLHVALKELVDRIGPAVLDDASTVRGVLDDVLDESIATVGDLNLLVDAVRLGAVPHLARILKTGADPAGAVSMAGARLARDRGGADPGASSWACAVLGFALGWVSEEVVLQFRPAPPASPAPATLVPDQPGSMARAARTWASPTVGATRPMPSSRSARPRPGPMSVAIALLGLILASVLGAAAVVVLTTDRGGDPDRSTQQARDSVTGPSSDADNSSATSSGGQADVSTDADDEAGSSADDPGRRAAIGCWDRQKVAGLGSCSLPTGLKGMLWVFPESGADGCSAVARGLHRRVVDRYCAVVLPNSGEAQFHYSEWFDFDQMRYNYRADQVGPDLPMERTDLHAFEVADPDAAHKVTLFYRLPDAPWSVTVYAMSAADMDVALGLLRIRPVKQLRGVGRQQQHLPTSFLVMRRTDG